MESRWQNNKIVLLGFGMLLFFALFSIFDPNEQWLNQATEDFDLKVYDQLVAYEPRTNQKAILAFENGECGQENTKFLQRKLKEKGDWFFGIPFGRGVYTEYIHLVYVHHFERVICNNKEYFRARLALKPNRTACDYLVKLNQCGTDLMERRIYRKMVNRLEALGIGDAGQYKPKRTIRLENCNCEF